MISSVTVSLTVVSLGAGLLLAAAYAASPLTVCVLVATPLLFAMAGRGLPADERRLLFVALGAALAARALFVTAQFLLAVPHLNDLSIGALSGDESYYLSRALRVRDIALGFASTKYDYFVASDDYGHTTYLTLLTAFQVIFGPTPYGMKIFNGLLFVAGAALLFRVARTAYGPAPALAGLVVVLFLPSLFVSSVTLLKESLYYLTASVLLVCGLAVVRGLTARHWRRAMVALAGLAVSLWVLNDLRRGALYLAVAGLGLAVAIRLVAGHRWRVAAVAVAIAVAVPIVATRPSLQDRVLGGVTAAAKVHAGHVFTLGHGYKLMDEGFYKTPETAAAWDVELTGPQAARFVIRAAVSFALTPLPWEMRSRSELAFLPEHLAWYVLLALLPIGAIAGWRLDPWVTSLLIGLAVPTAVVVAMTNGNVGTLLRLRGLVTPYLIWLSALGLIALGEKLVRAQAATGTPGLHPASQGAAT